MLLILSAVQPDPALIPDDLVSHVKWGGWLSGDELAAAYALAQVTLMPSMCFESAGMMALESMAAGTPVIGSPFGALPELIAHDETGYIINPLDTTSFAGAFAHLLGDPQAAQRMGDAGSARAQARFSLSCQVQAMERVYADAGDD
jgi:glycosyltransferase involved in cell wall biosynthesis